LFPLTPQDLHLENLAGTAALCFSTAAIGAATDRFGIRRVAAPSLLLLVAATYGLYAGAGRFPSGLLLLYVLAGIGAGAAVLAPIVMVRAFPPAVRFTGVSFSYNVSYAVFGGVTPPLVSWLTHFNRLSAAHYVAAVAVFSLVAIFAAPATQDFGERSS
jgi:MFS family permease